MKTLDELMIRGIENNEVIVATYTSVKEIHTKECWKIVDECDTLEEDNCV